MKKGDKVYCQPLGRDVILVKQLDVDRWRIYDEEWGYDEYSTDQLFEYDNSPSKKPNPYLNPYLTPCDLTQVKTKNYEEKGEMKMNLKAMFKGIGKIESGKAAITFDGKVVICRKDGEYVRYNEETKQIENYMQFVLKDASRFLFVLPTNVVTAGDVVIDKDKYFQVLSVKENGALNAVNLNSGTTTTICKETNIVGFNFYRKVSSLFGNGFGAAPAGVAGGFGAINPMMLLALGDGKMDDMLPLLLMGQGGMNNPLAMMALMGDGGLGGLGDMKDILLMQALAGNAGGFGNGLFNFGGTPVAPAYVPPVAPTDATE